MNIAPSKKDPPKDLSLRLLTREFATLVFVDGESFYVPCWAFDEAVSFITPHTCSDPSILYKVAVALSLARLRGRDEVAQ